jgi:hypothetical protein
MALTLTNLLGGASANTDTFNVASSAGAEVGGFVKVDEEYSIITEIPTATSVVVRSRGSFGGSCVAHQSLAPVTFGKVLDISKCAPGRTGTESAAPNKQGGYRIRTISADGPVDVASILDNTEFQITKGSIAAITLNQPPSLAVDGLRVRFVARTNFAHTITAAAGFYGGTAASSDVVTIAASGGSVEFEAEGGKWVVVSLANATAA